MKLRFPKDAADRFLIIAVAEVLLFILLLCAGCKTEKEIYYIIVKREDHKQISKPNRFEKQFQQADSAFMNNLRKASKEAREAVNKQVYLK